MPVPKARRGPGDTGHGGGNAPCGLHFAGGFLLGPPADYLPSSALQSQVRALNVSRGSKGVDLGFNMNFNFNRITH